jgi:hypothetical protein
LWYNLKWLLVVLFLIALLFFVLAVPTAGHGGVRSVQAEGVTEDTSTPTETILDGSGSDEVALYATSTQELVLGYIYEIFGDSGRNAEVVARCESGLRTGVISRTSDVGVFQINLTAHGWKIPGETRAEKITWLQDYKNNIDFAYQLWLNSGWSPWYPSKKCHGLS